MGPAPETVVLVHGLWVHGLAMELQRRALGRLGYRAVAYSYRSVRSSLAQNAEGLALYAASLPAPVVHFVGHSLGGVVVLSMLARGLGAGGGRIVLEGVPYRDSHAARELARWELGQAMLGKSIREWLDAEKDVDFARFEIGVIAGSWGFGLGRLVDSALPQPNDGVVAVEETRVPGMRDQIVLPVNHSGMLVSRAVHRQVAAFLRNGAFEKA
ncbi:MAG: alpha/beta hydrolase [Betaproteobacteria bacterium]|nr:alpha/beta hydrolase [Betaproteobacteria bacterium]